MLYLDTFIYLQELPWLVGGSEESRKRRDEGRGQRQSTNEQRPRLGDKCIQGEVIFDETGLGAHHPSAWAMQRT